MDYAIETLEKKLVDKMKELRFQDLTEDIKKVSLQIEDLRRAINDLIR